MNRSFLPFLFLLFLPTPLIADTGGGATDGGRLKIVSCPVKMSVKIKKYKELDPSAAAAALSPDEERNLIAKRISEIEAMSTQEIRERLNRSSAFETVMEPREDAVLLGEKDRFPKSLSKETLDGLSCPGADMVMVSKISGYGKVKKAWVTLLVGSGVFEGVFHGIIASKITGSGLVAAGAAIGEIVSEAFKWGGGAYLYGKKFTPVILETRLYSAKTGEMVFKATVISVVKKKMLEGATEEQKKDRNFRLGLARQKAMDATVSKIEKKISRMKR